MVRLACVSLPGFDLQIVAFRRPDWKRLPAAVVTEEKPLGRIVSANRVAWAAGVRPGMRYAASLGICPELRAAVVMEEEREALRMQLLDLLGGFTPEVEPATADPSLFWLNACGLDRLYPSVGSWASSVLSAVQSRGLVCGVAVGFSRFGTYAAARSARAVTLFEEEAQERAAALRAPLSVLPLEQEVSARLHQLGVTTVGGFLRFPPGALRRRFGKEAEALQLFARGEGGLALRPSRSPEPHRRELRLLHPDGSRERILRHQVDLLQPLIDEARSRREAIAEVVTELCGEQGPGSKDPGQDCLRQECLRQTILTTIPTLDPVRLERLLALRLETTGLAGPVERLAVEVRCVPSGREQGSLFGAPRRDPRSALAAVAEICAELGNDAVQVAELRDSHLPEEQFVWRRVDRFAPPMTGQLPGAGSTIGPRLIRRVLAEPTPIAPPPAGQEQPPMAGPYEVSGGWWQASYRREYYYFEDRRGRLLWVYRDARLGGWALQGAVE